MGVIYQIECAGRLYVGSTRSLPMRRSQHMHSLRRGNHHSRFLQRSYAKHGEAAIRFSVLEADVPDAQLIEVEAKYITALRPAFNGAQPGPTRRGAKHTPESLERMRIAQRAAGHRHSAASRQKISQSLKGNARSAGRPNARKVTPPVMDQILTLRAEGLGFRRIARVVGLSKKTVSNNVRSIVTWAR